MAITDSALSRIITSQAPIPGASLATRILVNKLRIQASADPSSLGTRIAELSAFVLKNPSVEAELAGF